MMKHIWAHIECQVLWERFYKHFNWLNLNFDQITQTQHTPIVLKFSSLIIHKIYTKVWKLHTHLPVRINSMLSCFLSCSSVSRLRFSLQPCYVFACLRLLVSSWQWVSAEIRPAPNPSDFAGNQIETHWSSNTRMLVM